MPKYGFFRYGTSVYGNLLRETSKSQLFAQAVDYGKVRVTILAGPRVGSGYVLVRTKNGSASDPSAGVVVSSGVVTGQEFFVTDGETNFEDDIVVNDVAVPTGSVFYTLFIITETGTWVKDAATYLFSPKDAGTLSHFLEVLPRVLTTSTGNPLDVPETNTDLAKFLGGVSVTYDEFQTEVDSMLPAESRKSNVLRGFHESLARSVGMPVEFTVGVGSSARLFRDAGFIYREKGTISGVVAYTEALTGWPTIAYDSPNMIRYLDDASFESGIGRWEVAGAALNSQLVGGLYSAPELPHDYFLSPFAGDAIGLVQLTDTSATLSLPEFPTPEEAASSSTGRTLDARASCIPVISGNTYYASLYVNQYVVDGSATLTVSVDWLDQQGESVSTSTFAGHDVSALSGWTRVVEEVTAPATAAFARLILSFDGSVDDVFGIDSVQFATTDIHYHDPRSVTVICAPTRVNLLTDGSFTAGSEWTAITGSATRDSGGLFGTHCLSVSGSTEFNIVSETIPAQPGLILNFSSYVLGDAASAKIEYLDSSNEVIDVTPLDDTIINNYEGLIDFEATSEWSRISVTALGPDGTESVRVRIFGDGDLLIDAALLERSEQAKIYFDADVADEGGEDAVVATFDGHAYPMLYPSRLSRLSRLRATLPFYLPFGVSFRVLLWDSDDPAVTDFLPYGT